VSPERDEPTEEQEPELYEDVPPRSIFAAAWFRVVLVVIVLGVVGALAVPYILDWMNPPPPPRTALTKPLAGSSLPSTPAPALDKPAADKPAADKKDSTLIPAPPAPIPVPAPPARTELKSELKPGATTPSKPPAEPKTTAKAAAPPAKPVPVPAPAPAEAKSKTAAAPPKDDARPAAATKPATPRRAATKATPPAAPAARGPFWVQVGAFKDAESAKRLATKLREANFKVEESIKRVGGSSTTTTAPAAAAPATTAPAGTGADQYDVFVTGMSVEELNKRLAGKGLAAETSGGGVIVKPSLPLRDAVALSKDLAVDGFKVQVRRAGGAAAAAAAAPAPPAAADAGGTELHRVRVGAFSDRAAAQAAARELEAKGYKPFIARGDQ
jgi:cell division septation protein DedD